LPSSLPCTTTAQALTLALTFPFGPMVRQFPFGSNGAFYLAIYIKVFAAREFHFNHNRLADAGHFPAGSIRGFERFHECSPLGNCSGEFDSTPMRTTPRRQRQGSGKGSPGSDAAS